MTDIQKTNIFVVLPLHDHQFVLVHWHMFSFLNVAFLISTGTLYFDAMCQSVCCITYYADQGFKPIVHDHTISLIEKGGY
jgi:hypothetical protein